MAMGIIDSNENDGVAKFIESKVVRWKNKY
jgi:hypothetical protein